MANDPTLSHGSSRKASSILLPVEKAAYDSLLGME